MKNILCAAIAFAALAATAGTAESQTPVAHVTTHIDQARMAIILAGRDRPTDAEVASAAAAMERGATRTQIQAIARSSAPDRSLVVAYEAVASLAARGMPAKQAVYRVQANITSLASDSVLAELATVDGGAVASASVANNRPR